MNYTYDLNTNGCLIITADSIDREHLEDSKDEFEALEPLICNSDLEWIDPSETGDLTSAPMLGIRNEDGFVFARWAYMDYQIKSLVEDLIVKGKAVFVS